MRLILWGRGRLALLENRWMPLIEDWCLVSFFFFPLVLHSKLYDLFTLFDFISMYIWFLTDPFCSALKFLCSCGYNLCLAVSFPSLLLLFFLLVLRWTQGLTKGVLCHSVTLTLFFYLALTQLCGSVAHSWCIFLYTLLICFMSRWSSTYLQNLHTF